MIATPIAVSPAGENDQSSAARRLSIRRPWSLNCPPCEGDAAVASGTCQQLLEVLCVRTFYPVVLADFLELLERICTRHFETVVVGFCTADVCRNQRLVDEIGDARDHLLCCDRFMGSYGDRCLHGEGTVKCRETPKNGLLWTGQQIVTPVELRAQRVMPGQRRASPAHQQRKTIVKSRQKALDAEGRDMRRRQFQRQRHAVQPAADCHHCWEVVIVDGKPIGDGRCTFVEQLNRRILQCTASDDVGRARRTFQRSETMPHLALHPQRFAAGGKHRAARRATL